MTSDASRPEARIVQSLRSKRGDAHAYWLDRGRRRFESELLADAVPADAAKALLDRIESDLFDVGVDLDAVLRDLAAREVPEVPFDSLGKSDKPEDRTARPNPTRTP